MKRKKALRYLVLLLVMIFSLMGCGKAEPVPDETAEEIVIEEQTEPDVTETEATEETVPEETSSSEISYTANNELASGEGIVYSYQAEETGNGYHITLEYSVPAGMDAGAYLWANMVRETLWEREPFTTGTCDTLEFDVTAEQAAQWEDLNIAFGSEETGCFSVATKLPFQHLQTGGYSLGAATGLGYTIDNELKSGSYEIYGCMVQKLDNDHFRFCIDFNATAGMSVIVFRSPDVGYQIFHQSTTTGQRQQLAFDISAEDISSAPVLMLNFSVSDHDRFFVEIPLATIHTHTDGTPVGNEQEIPCFEVEVADNFVFHGAVVRPLDNGSYRYTLQCGTPAETPCTVLFGEKALCFASDGSGEPVCIQFDLDVKTAVSEKQFSLTVSPPDGGQTVLTFENPIAQ